MKKTLSIILSLAMLLSTIIIPSAFIVSAEEVTTLTATYYVDATVESSGDGLTAETAFKTIDEAETAAAAQENNTTVVNATVYIIGTATYKPAVAHKGMITFDGNGTGSLNFTYNKWFGGLYDVFAIFGPTSFQNITFNNNIGFATFGYELNFGENVVLVANGNQVIRVGNNYQDGRGGDKLVINSYSLNEFGKGVSIYVTPVANYPENKKGGNAFVEFNGGSYCRLDINQGIYQGLLSFTFNNATKEYYSQGGFLNGTPTFNDAVQFIFNNGLSKADYIGTTFDNIDAANGLWFVSSTVGGKLIATETAGKFDVESNLIAVATNVTTGKVVKSAGGILDISGVDNAGTWNVTYQEPSCTELYVSATGSDDNNGLTADSALATINKAIEKFKGEDGTIYVSGTVNFDGGVAHAGMITIDGQGTGAINFVNNKWYQGINDVLALNGPTTFKNIKLNNVVAFATNGYELKFENVDSTATSNQELFVGNNYQDGRGGDKLVVDGMSFTYGKGAKIHLTPVANNPANKTGGNTEVIFNSGSFMRLNINEGIYQGLVSFTFNGGEPAAYFQGAFLNGAPTFNDGLQFIFNNGLSKESFIGTTFDSLTAAKGVWFVSGTADGKLVATETAGIFNVEGDYLAVANNSESGAVIKSADGVLDLSKVPGTYDVTYELPAVDTVYVSATGSDENNGLTEQTAFATIDRAIKRLNNADGTIYVSGTVDFKPTENHTGMITIDGKGTGSVNLIINANLSTDVVDVKGPTTFQNITLAKSNKYISLATNGSELIFGENVSSGNYQYIYVGNAANNSTSEKLTINSYTGTDWEYYLGTRLVVGPLAKNISNATVGNIDLVFNGGTYQSFDISAGRYTGNVNITYNSGALANSNGKVLSVADGAVFEGAVQAIFNNALSKQTFVGTALDNISAAKGKWIISGVAGGIISTTDDAGIFKVTSDLTAKATNIKTGDSYFSINGYLEIPEGEYNVSYIKDENIVKTFYVSENGSDGNNGLTKNSAVKSLAKAFEIASKTAKVVVVDTAEYDITKAYGKNLTIIGGKITKDSDITLYDNLIVENIVFDAPAIITNGNTLIIGDGVSFENGTPTVVTDKRLLIYSGNFEDIKIEGSAVSKLYSYGANVKKVIVSTVHTNAIVKVNVEGGAELLFSDDAQYKSAEVIFNKTATEVTTEAENGWIIGSELSGNSRVDFSDTTGKYTVTTENTKTPVAVSKDGTTVYVADEFDNTYDEIDLTAGAATDYSDFINYRSGIPNVYKKLQNNEELSVVYFGGSVTAGAGLPNDADREVNSWRAKIGNWITNNFPNSKITNINKAASESGTYLGAYRIPYIIEQQPDLLFIEYAINDYYYSATDDEASSQFETIVREIKAALPDCDIVTLLTTEQKFYSEASQGKLHSQAQQHENVSAYYNIPSIKIGCALTSQISSNEWGTYFKDIVHPTAAGYQIYYECIEEFMYNSLFCADYDENNMFIMPPVYSSYLFDGSRESTGITEEMLSYSQQQGGTGFTYSAQSDSRGEMSGRVTSSAVGSTFYLKFYGTEVSLALSPTDSNKLPTISIDGGASFAANTNSLALNPIKIAKDLELGWHTVKVTTTYASTVIEGIYTAVSDNNTLKGEGADATYKKATLTLNAGTYNIKYLNDITTDLLVAPEKQGYTFVGWADEDGNIVTELTAGAKLVATYEENTLSEEDEPFDLSGDGKINGEDLILLRKALLKINNLVDFDLNGDKKSDIRDLIALKEKIALLENN